MPIRSTVNPTPATIKKRQQVVIGPWEAISATVFMRFALGKETASVVLSAEDGSAGWMVTKPRTNGSVSLGRATGDHTLLAAKAAADAVLRQMGYQVPIG